MRQLTLPLLSLAISIWATVSPQSFAHEEPLQKGAVESLESFLARDQIPSHSIATSSLVSRLNELAVQIRFAHNQSPENNAIEPIANRLLDFARDLADVKKDQSKVRELMVTQNGLAELTEDLVELTRIEKWMKTEFRSLPHPKFESFIMYQVTSSALDTHPIQSIRSLNLMTSPKTHFRLSSQVRSTLERSLLEANIALLNGARTQSKTDLLKQTQYVDKSLMTYRDFLAGVLISANEFAQVQPLFRSRANGDSHDALEELTAHIRDWPTSPPRSRSIPFQLGYQTQAETQSALIVAEHSDRLHPVRRSHLHRALLRLHAFLTGKLDRQTKISAYREWGESLALSILFTPAGSLMAYYAITAESMHLFAKLVYAGGFLGGGLVAPAVAFLLANQSANERLVNIDSDAFAARVESNRVALRKNALLLRQEVGSGSTEEVRYLEALAENEQNAPLRKSILESARSKRCDQSLSP